MSSGQNQVFFDPTGKRSKWVSVALAAACLCLSAIAAVFVISSANAPLLPAIPLALEREFLPPLPAPQRNAHREDWDLREDRVRSDPNLATSNVTRFAFYTNWDKNSFLSLRAHAHDLDVLLPEWLHMTGEHGRVVADDEREQQVLGDWIEKNASHLQVIPVINNYDNAAKKWRGAETGALLRSKEARSGLVDTLRRYLQSDRIDGLAIDFKEIPKDDRALLVDFVKELKTAIAGARKKVLVVLPAYDRPDSYFNIVEAADQVILLAYDQHSAYDSPGPLAAQGWFEALLDQFFEKVAGRKIVVAIGSYAIDWSAAGEANIVSIQEAWDITHRADAKMAFNEESLNPELSYRERSSGGTHTVWMLDGVTTFNQMAAALAMEPGGIALWRLGTEDPTVWATLARGRAPNQKALADLEVLDPGQAVAYQGKGEILKFAGQARLGKREIQHLPKYNLITGQWLKSVSRSMTISRTGFNKEKVIALTFDDGPSVYTAPILDVLKQKKVKATFFVVGAVAALAPRVLRRIHAEGHDIGNHTFTHPDLSEIPGAQLDMELNATQRVLESQIGIRTTLFRPPFVKDVEPETQTQARTLQASAALGYITIGQRIDPLDWDRPGADEIVKRTVAYALRQDGNIVLLHDGGGDRKQTIAALPRIIDELRAKGFRFATVHELLGLQRDALMPPLLSNSDYVPIVNDVGFSIARSFSDGLKVFFILGLFLGVARLVAISLAAGWQTMTYAKRRKPLETRPTLAVIVPAYNEERVIADCIRSLLGSRRTDFEIVVVDDGSVDGTSGAVREAFAGEPRVRLITKENGGKSSALNTGILATSAEIVVCIDADTRLAPDALDKLIANFGDEDVGAVAGLVTIGNRSTLLSRFQALEYITAQSMDRRAFSLVNGISVVPGAIGAWRRKAIVDAGLYDGDTFAEDADLTMKLERAGWRVVNEADAIAVTEAPETLREFNKQRFRWMFGTIQAAYKHRDIYFQRGAWGLKAFTFPNIIIFQFLFTLISPVMDLLVVLAIVSDGWSYLYHGGSFVSDRTYEIGNYWMIFQVLEFAFAVIAVMLHRLPGNWSLLPLVFLQRFCYRQLIFWISFRTFLAALRGRLASWGKAKRKGLTQSQSDLAMGSGRGLHPAE
ncbi:MAG: glycosyltransferase [Hyphomicrobiaceae bacterium]